jgi:hypothetical protein
LLGRIDTAKTAPIVVASPQPAGAAESSPLLGAAAVGAMSDAEIEALLLSRLDNP